MENYGIDMKGKIQVENVSTLPAWASTDERRVIYVADEDKLYYGSNSEWVAVLDNNYVSGHNKGWYKRPYFEHVDDDTIDIYPGAYHYEGNGTTPPEQIVYWNDKLTFQLGSGGSNASSSALGADEWHFIYLHAPSINTNDSPILDETCFINSTVQPPILTTGGYGFYYSTSRSIFMLKTDGDGDIIEFYQADNYISWADYVSIYSNLTLSTTWQNATLDLPISMGINLKANVTFYQSYVSGSSPYLWWRTDGQTGSNGHVVSEVSEDDIASVTNQDVVGRKSTNVIEVKSTNASSNLIIYQNGYYLPIGM